MANSDYVLRGKTLGFCPNAVVIASLTHLADTLTVENFRSPTGQTLTQAALNKAALIDNEIVIVTAVAGDVLTIGRGCCDTIPAEHLASAKIWFFDGAIGSDDIEYGGTETISVKPVPRTSAGPVTIPNAPPENITFVNRFLRPYPPGNLLVNGIPWFTLAMANASTGGLVLAWTHRDRITQQDTLIDHMQSSIGPEVGTTYRIKIYDSDDVLVRTVDAISGPTHTYAFADAIDDFGITPGQTAVGYARVMSVRDTLESLFQYRINFWVQLVTIKDLTLSWSVGTTSVTKDLTLSWTVEATGVIADLTLSWAVRESVETDLALAWAVRGTVQKDLPLAWSVDSASVIKDLTLLWDVRGAVQKDLPLAWAVRGAVQKDLPLAWVVADPFYANVALLLHCNGTNGSTTFTDNSPTPKTVTAVGNAQVTTSTPLLGSGSALFDGSGDRLTVPHSSDFDFGSGDFTIELRFRAASSSNALLIGKRTNSTVTGPFALLYEGSIGRVTCYFDSDGTAPWAANLFGTGIASGTTYVIAVGRSGTSWMIFVNGTMVGSFTGSMTLFSNSASLSIGGDLDGVIPFNGRIDEIRLTKGICRYTSNYTVGTSEFDNS